MVEAIHRVLVVEDEPETQMLIERAIKSLDDRIACMWTKSAEEAKKALTDDARYDLIIADHFLKGTETGFDLWKVCRKKYAQVPFILTSALNIEFFDTLTRDEKRPPLFLHKPFGVTDCRNMVEWYWEDIGYNIDLKKKKDPHTEIAARKKRFLAALVPIVMILVFAALFLFQLNTLPFPDLDQDSAAANHPTPEKLFEPPRTRPNVIQGSDWFQRMIARELKREIAVPQRINEWPLGAGSPPGAAQPDPAQLEMPQEDLSQPSLLPDKLQGLPLENFYDGNERSEYFLRLSHSV